MKNVKFLLIAIIVLIGACQPQVSAQTVFLRSNQFYESYTGVAGDTASGTTAKNFDIQVSKGVMYFYDVAVTADSSGDASNFSVQLSGSNDNSNWYTIGDAITWYVTSSTDTVIRFTNMTSISTSTSIAATSDYHDLDYPLKYEYHAFDSATGVATTWVDTVSIAAAVVTDTVTVGARTITETITEPSVGWRYLRVGFTGAGAGAKGEIERLTVAIRPKLFGF